MPKRLLIVTTVPETLAFILRQQPEFLGRHFDVSLVCSDGPELAVVAVEEGVPVQVVPMERGISPLKDLVSVWKMVLLLRREKPDIVHSYTPKAGLVAMLAAWLCGVPVRIHTFTGLIWPTATGWRRKLLMAVDRLLCACATHIVPEGNGVKQDLTLGRITAKRLQVIGYGNIAGVDIEYFSPSDDSLRHAADELRSSFSIQPSDLVFVFVGRLNQDKGLKELVGAFEQLTGNCRLLVVGGNDSSAPLDQTVLQRLQNHPRVHCLGFLRDIRPALLMADVLVLPSYREGFPNVVLQAGAMELPVLATDISGCNEAIEPGLNGWLVPPRDIHALATAMSSILELPRGDLRQMGRAARMRIVERFERQAHWRRMLEFYCAVGKAVQGSAQGAPRLLLIAGLAESILNFRGDLLRAFQSKGLEIHVAAPPLADESGLRRDLEACGWIVHDIPLLRAGVNPLADLRTLWNLWRLMCRVKPDWVLPYTIKPVIYGLLAARLAGVPGRYAMITGLGYAFMGNAKRSQLARLVRGLYRVALRSASKVFFQNGDDERLFRQLNLLKPDTPSCVVNGSGVNIAQFEVAPLPDSGLSFLLIARLLGDKGVREFVSAARKVKEKYPEARFSMVGWIDANPDCISSGELASWVEEGLIDYLGRLSDVRPAIASHTVYVLPSYREGTPRSVLEAMAMGRPIITTDAPGCRETVIDGVNGFVVPVKSAEALVQAMLMFIEEPGIAERMGAHSRDIAETKYDVHKVNEVVMTEMGIR